MTTSPQSYFWCSQLKVQCTSLRVDRTCCVVLVRCASRVSRCAVTTSAPTPDTCSPLPVRNVSSSFHLLHMHCVVSQLVARCHLELRITCVVVFDLTERRPGSCPNVNDVALDGQECPSDAFCSTGQKCCVNAFGAAVCVEAGA